jgi:hypothetical protein
MVHGNEMAHGKGAIERTATSSARQRCSRAHGKEKTHGKERSQRTAKNHRTAKNTDTAKGAFAVRIQVFSFFSFLFYSFYYLCLFLN